MALWVRGWPHGPREGRADWGPHRGHPGRDRLHGRYPCVFGGDLHANPEDIPLLQDLLDRVGWVDVGTHVRWAPGGPEPTCFTPGAAEGTRRDYIFVDHHMWPAVAGYAVRQEHTFPVHFPVQMAMKA